VAAVALEGFAKLAEMLNAANAATTDHSEGLSTALYAYVTFAERNPALYDAMFTMGTDLSFGKQDTPAQLKAAFDAIKNAVSPLAGGYDPATLAELAWSALHGLVTLNRSGRLPPEATTLRMAVLGRLFGAHL
jgi:hypothetical protein